MKMSKFLIALVVIVFIIGVAFEIWCACTYGGKPAGEVPFWVFWVIRN